MLSFVFIKDTNPTCDVTRFAESAIYILHIFASKLKEIVYYIKRPIGLFFYALSDKTIKIFIANTL